MGTNVFLYVSSTKDMCLLFGNDRNNIISYKDAERAGDKTTASHRVEGDYDEN